jgi:flagellar hook-associated protein 1 FlgK
MSSLLGCLSSAARSLNAQSMGLAVVGQNIANVNTPNYARRVVDLGAVPPLESWSAGGGVEVLGIRSARDLLVEARLGQELAYEGAQSALADGLAEVNAAFGVGGASVDGALTAFFDAFANLAGDPTAPSARQAVLSESASLAATFHDLAGRLADARTNADTRVLSAVDQVNELATRLAAVNQSMATAGAADSPQRLQYRDEQLGLIEKLSGLLQVQTVAREDGGFDVTFGNGRALVIGTIAVPLDTTREADGTARLTSQGVDVTSEIPGGEIDGLLSLRDDLVPGYLARLDALAFSVATEVNARHGAGFDLSGAPGQPLFSVGATADGTAAALAVNPTIAGQPRMVAAAGSALPGDNTTARAIAALRSTRVLEGGTATFAEGFAALVHEAGQDAATASDRRDGAAEVALEIRNLREAVSGVSLDEEAALMLRFQRAYEANARYFQSVEAALDILMQMVGR